MRAARGAQFWSLDFYSLRHNRNTVHLPNYSNGSQILVESGLNLRYGGLQSMQYAKISVPTHSRYMNKFEEKVICYQLELEKQRVRDNLLFIYAEAN